MKKILFVCVENAGRSQIAEGFFRKFSKKFEVSSAGTEPKSELNPVVIEVMKEIAKIMREKNPVWGV